MYKNHMDPITRQDEKETLLITFAGLCQHPTQKLRSMFAHAFVTLVLMKAPLATFLVAT